MGGGPGSEAPWKLSYLAARARWHRAPSEEKTAWCITTRQPSPETCLEQDYSLSRASHFSWSRGYRALYNLCYRKAGRDLNARLEEPLHKPQPDQLWFPRSFSSLCLRDSWVNVCRKKDTWNMEWNMSQPYFIGSQILQTTWEASEILAWKWPFLRIEVSFYWSLRSAY